MIGTILRNIRKIRGLTQSNVGDELKLADNTISNYVEIKEKLLSLDEGITFNGETDSEVIANLLAFYYLKTSSILEALKNTIKLIKGTYAIAFVVEDKKDIIYFARSFMPLYISFNEGTSYLGSDLYALPKSNKYYEVKDNTFGFMNGYQYKAFNLKKEVVYIDVENNYERNALSMNGFSSFMEKELNEISSIQKVLIEKYKYSKVLKVVQKIIRKDVYWTSIFVRCLQKKRQQTSEEDKTMSNGDYGYFGKGDTGYAQYMTAFNRNFGGSSGGGGGGGDHNNGGGGGGDGRFGHKLFEVPDSLAVSLLVAQHVLVAFIQAVV